MHGRSLGEIRNAGDISQHKKATYRKYTANIIINEEKLRAFFAKIMTQTRISMLLLMFNLKF